MTIELSALELGYTRDVLRFAARRRCFKANCGTVCLCDGCAARKVLPIFDAVIQAAINSSKSEDKR